MSQDQSMDGTKARLREAFERVEPEFQKLQEEALRKITVDVPTAVGTILGCLPKIRGFRPQIMAELPKYDIRLFDRLEEYALALAYAHGAYVATSERPRTLVDLGQEAASLRDVMVADAMALATRGLFDRARIEAIRMGAGYRDTAVDLVALVSLYRTRWSAIEGKTGISLGELETAEILADRLMTAVGVREQEPVERGAAIDSRMRAFALFLRAYSHARRAIIYLRIDEGDADRIAPSLYAGRMR